MELCEGLVRQGVSELHTYWNGNTEPFYTFGHTQKYMHTKVY